MEHGQDRAGVVADGWLPHTVRAMAHLIAQRTSREVETTARDWRGCRTHARASSGSATSRHVVRGRRSASTPAVALGGVARRGHGKRGPRRGDAATSAAAERPRGPGRSARHRAAREISADHGRTRCPRGRERKPQRRAEYVPPGSARRSVVRAEPSGRRLERLR